MNLRAYCILHVSLSTHYFVYQDLFRIKTPAKTPAGLSKHFALYIDRIVIKVWRIRQAFPCVLLYNVCTFPRCFAATFKENKHGKTIVPFCTHLGSGQGQNVDEISRLCPGSSVLEGLAIKGSSVNGTQNDLSAWLLRLDISDKK